MSPSRRFAVNAPGVIHENIDGETMILNLNSGRYFGLSGVSAEIWDLVSASTEIDGVVSSIASRYRGDPATIDQGVREFVSALQQEGLVSDLPEDAATASAVSEPPAGNEPLVFSPPVLHAYTDMEQLLLLDPIHEVDDSLGWPHPRKT